MTNPNGSAFPCGDLTQFGCAPEPGLTKRELFAAMAMQGMLANSYVREKDDFDITAASAQFADALIIELAKEKKS